MRIKTKYFLCIGVFAFSGYGLSGCHSMTDVTDYEIPEQRDQELSRHEYNEFCNKIENINSPKCAGNYVPDLPPKP